MEDDELIQDELARCEDFKYFAFNYLKIKDEVGNIIPFVLNQAQEKFLELFYKTKKKWFIILKPRQLGISTLIQGLIFQYLFLHFNQKSLTMGHKTEASNNLFDIYRRYYDYMPDWFKPILEKSNEKKISYSDRGCENKIETAGSDEIGRSDTYQIVHLTEVAFYPNSKQALLGLMQGSKYANMFIIESTANGFNDFRERWVEAKKNNSDFAPFFLSWLQFPPYSKNFDNNEQKEAFRKSLSSIATYNEYEREEINLVEFHKATLEQLNWRRWAIDTLCNRDVSKFHQEYPTTDNEAFISSGRPVFEVKTCQKNLVEAAFPIKTGNLITIYDETNLEYRKLKDPSYLEAKKYIKEVIFQDNPGGYIKIFEPIKVGDYDHYNYAAGVDVAEGLEQGDYSVIKVLDRKTDKVVLTWHGHIDPDLLAEEIYKLHLFLKKEVYFNIEMNNHGLTTITSAYLLGVNQYYREDFRKGWSEDKSFLGTKTTQQTKPLMINDLNEYIREGLFEDKEKEFWEETLTYVRNAKGSMNAQNKDTDPGVKCFDDRVMSAALMIKCHKWMPTFKTEKIVETPLWLNNAQKKNKLNKTSVMSI